MTLLILIQVEVSERTETLFEAADIRCTAESSTLIVVLNVLIRSHGVKSLGNVLSLNVTIVRNYGLTRLSTLGGNQDYTICTLRTIDSCRSSILQHGNVLNVRRSNVTDAGYWESVYDVERRVVTSDRTTTTHLDDHFCIR